MAATILVVEDNPHSRQIIKDILELEGYTVWTASNGLDALELLGTQPHLPDLIISATLMPSMNGFALLSSVRARWPLIPFILLATKGDPEKSRRGDANAILVEPFTAQELLLAVVAHLSQVKPVQDILTELDEDAPKAVVSRDVSQREEAKPAKPSEPDWQTVRGGAALPDDGLGLDKEKKDQQEPPLARPVAPAPHYEPPPQPIPAGASSSGEVTDEFDEALPDVAVPEQSQGAAPPPPPVEIPDYQMRPASPQSRRRVPDVTFGRQYRSSSNTPVSSSIQAHFSSYYPAAIKPNQPYTLMVFAHLESLREQVQERAARYVDMMGGKQESGTTPSRVQIAAGSLITFVPQIPGITFDPPEYCVIWQPPYLHSATFLFTTPADLKADLTGRVSVFMGPLIIGEIPVTMQFVPQTVSTTLDKSSEFHKFDPIFASYSHRDTPVMEFFRRARQHTGQKMLVDIYDLRAGEHWAQRLLDMIDESAVFQLFWSAHSAQSKYCRQEWEYACRYMENRPRFIQPVWWEAPMPPPPTQLADLHFQRIELPPATRMRLVVGRLKELFNRNKT